MSYESMAEFHDLFMAGAWARLRPVVVAAFAGLSAGDLVIDLGAGTGLGTLALAESTPARIWALEPATTMRAVLLHRLAASADLAARVSVLAGAVPAALQDVPVPVAGVLATHVVGHLSARERAQLFAWMAAHLAPDGVALVTHQPPDLHELQELPDLQELQEQETVDNIVEETRVGDHIYRATYRGAGQEFRTVYDVLDDAGRTVRSLTARGSWATVTFAQLSAEAAASGLRCRAADLGGVCFVSH